MPVGKIVRVRSHRATVKTVGFTQRSTRGRGEFGGQGGRDIILKFEKSPCTLLPGRWEGEEVEPLWKSIWCLLVNIRLPYDKAVSLLSIHPR